MRTIVELPETQLQALDAVCRREGISRAEAVRRSVARYLEENRALDGPAAFGIWRARQVDGLEYEASIRREWDPAPAAADRRR